MGAPIPVRQFASTAEMQAHYAAIHARCFNPEPRVAPAVTISGTARPVWQAPRVTEQIQVKTLGKLRGRGMSGADAIRFVAALSGCTREQILSQQRGADVARARHIICWLLVRHAGLSLPQIGSKLGNRDHTTILYGERRVSAAIVKLGLTLPKDPKAQAKILWEAKWPKSVLGQDKRPC